MSFLIFVFALFFKSAYRGLIWCGAIIFWGGAIYLAKELPSIHREYQIYLCSDVSMVYDESMDKCVQVIEKK